MLAMRRTKIVCTVGPSTEPVRVMRRLGGYVDVFRINFSHGNKTSHLQEIMAIRGAARTARRNIAILQDLPGPKIRVGRIKGGAVDLLKGSSFLLTSREAEGDSTVATLNYPALLKSVRRGDVLHLADGIIRLKVEEGDGSEVRCTVLAGGTLSSGKGVNAPGIDLKIPYPTAADVGHLKFGFSKGLEYVALSFIRTARDVRAVRQLIGGDGPSIVVKIEKKEAVENFDAIMAEADGVMVARGDLGIEVPIENVPVIQKEIIRKCNDAGKPVIVATQMLVNMVNYPIPSRAEVSDVSTAVLDGADAVMLSDETAVGKYPVEAVKTLDRIALAAENVLRKYGPPRPEPAKLPTEEAIGRAACRLAEYIGAKVIVAPTQTGSTAKRVSKYRPMQPIVALCSEKRVARLLSLYWGVFAVISKQSKSAEQNYSRAQAVASSAGLVKRGDRIVVTSGTMGMKGSTDLLKVITVGERPIP